MNQRLSLALALLCAISMIPAATATVRYVDADASGTGDGLSWGNAHTDLQAGLTAALGGLDEIWVAEGTYIPGVTRASTFTMKNGVTVYGGFSGSETQVSQRDISANLTILSGDVAGNDLSVSFTSLSPATHTNRSDNVKHVVTGTDNAVFDGLVIAGGYAELTDETNADGQGAGIYCDGVSPTFRNCIVVDNYAYYGGGATMWGGGSPKFERCIFSGNWAGYGGAGIAGRGAALIDRCYVVGGDGGYTGGGLFFEHQYITVVTNCLIAGNRSDAGGGMRVDSNDVQVVNCTFSGNEAAYQGGVFIRRNGSDPTFKNCIFWGDDSTMWDATHEEVGGDGGTATFTYSDVMGGAGSGLNSDWSFGTGCIDQDPVFRTAPSGTWTAVSSYDAVLRVTTLTDSTAAWTPGEFVGQSVLVSTTSYKQLYILDNTANTITVVGDATVAASTGSEYEIRDYRLDVGSLCADTGTDVGAPTNDIIGFFRPTGLGTDMGAYETPSVSITVAANPAGMGIEVSLNAETNVAPNAYSVSLGTTPEISVESPQIPGSGVMYTWSSWSDSGAQTHTIDADSNKTVTASFTTQYLWSVSISPLGGGTVTPSSGSWYSPGASFTAIVTTNSGWQFDGWSGDLSGSVTNPAVTMDSAKTVTAQFTALGTPVTIETSPTGLAVIVDGLPSVGGTAFSWNNGSVHTVGVATATQESADGVRHTWQNWSDAGAQTHAITVTGPETITANFDTEYEWTWGLNVARSGSVSPSNGSWYAPSASFTAIATPSVGWNFQWWSGDASGQTTNIAVTITNPLSVVANFSVPAAAGVTYVDENAVGANDGSDWLNAYASLATAIDAALSGAEIWVAEGTYTPGSTRTSAFSLQNNIAIYAGFTGLERIRNARNFTNNITILSGDVNGDDTASFGNRDDNVYNVVSADAVTGSLIDGFVIKGGSATNTNFTLPSGAGAGVRINDSTSVSVRNCILLDNIATGGGGMYVRRSVNTKLINCTFVGNRATDTSNDRGSGALGGDAVSSTQTTLVEGCDFAGNAAPSGVGGAIYTGTGPWAVNFTNCLFAGNRSGYLGGQGGAIYLREYPSRLVNCTFSGNYPEGLYVNMIVGQEPVTVSSIYWSSNIANQIVNAGGAYNVRVERSDVNQAGYVPLNFNIIQDPEWLRDEAGWWSSQSLYDPASGTTVLYYDPGTWTPNELIGSYVAPNGSQYLQYKVKGNTATTITVWGDGQALGTVGVKYAIRDYHLKYTSPCIDTGHPSYDGSREPDYPEGTINMGRYGNTAEASSSDPPPIDLSGTIIYIRGGQTEL